MLFYFDKKKALMPLCFKKPRPVSTSTCRIKLSNGYWISYVFYKIQFNLLLSSASANCLKNIWFKDRTI